MDRLTDLASGFQRLEDRITQRVDGLTGQFLPRDEYEARHSDVRNQITKLDSRIDAEATERKALEDKLAVQRRFALTTSLMGLAAVISLLALVLANLPR